MGIEWEDIAESVRIDEVLNDLGVDVHEVVRGEHWASCPLPSHPGSDQKPSFSINEDTYLFNCFTCSEGGPLPLLVASMEGMETDDTSTRWEKALYWLLPYSDADIEGDDGFMEQLERYLQRADAKVKLNRTPDLPYYSPRVIERLEFAPLEVLAKWGIKHEGTVEQFGIRYDPQRRRLKGGQEYEGPAIVIPHILRGDIIGYQERWLSDDRPKWVPKYTNSENFPKKTTIYNFDGIVAEGRKGMPSVVVESTMTTARLWEVGYSSGATFGASVTPDQIRLLRSLHSGVILAFDDDPDYVNDTGKLVRGAGKKALSNLVEALADSIPIWSASVGTDDKSDLADLDDEQIHAVISRAVWRFA